MAKNKSGNTIIQTLLLVYCVVLTIIIAVLHSEIKTQQQIITSMQEEMSDISEKVYYDDLKTSWVLVGEFDSFYVATKTYKGE